MKYIEIEVCVLSYSSVMPHLQRVSSRFVGKVTFSSQRQKFEFVAMSNVKMDFSFLV